MIKYNIGKGEIVIQYFPTGDMWSDINTKTLQGRLLYNICGRLIGIGEGYDDDIDRLNTHQDLLPSQKCANHVSDKYASVLSKPGSIVKVLEVAQNELPNATKKTQPVVAAFLFTKTMARRTWGSSCHCRSVLGDKGKPLRSGDKGTRTNECLRVRRPKPRRLTYRNTGTRKLLYRQTGEKGTYTNKLIRARTRHKYVLAAQYILVSS